MMGGASRLSRLIVLLKMVVVLRRKMVVAMTSIHHHHMDYFDYFYFHWVGLGILNLSTLDRSAFPSYESNWVTLMWQRMDCIPRQMEQQWTLMGLTTAGKSVGIVLELVER